MDIFYTFLSTYADARRFFGLWQSLKIAVLWTRITHIDSRR